MSKLEIPPNEALYPLPVVLVTCTDKACKRPNIITIAWCGVVCSKPPLISISIRPSRHSNKIIKDSGEFGINIPTKSLLAKTDKCGMVSGLTTDKFKACGFTPFASKKISAPLIKECHVNIECRLKECISLGSHDMFIGEVIFVHADDTVMAAGGAIDYKKSDPVVYNQGEYWSLGAKIGYYGYSSRQ